MEPTAAFAQLQLGFVDQIQWRYEVIRPLVLFADRTAQQRAQETETHPDTVRTLQRRFQRQGMLGLVPATLKISPRGRTPRVPDAVRQEINRLKALYAGFHDRELARILFFTFGYPIHHNTVKQLWQQSSITALQEPVQWDYRAYADRFQARLQIVRLYYQGWDKVSLSRFLRISRPTVDRWIARFEAEHFAGLIDHKRGPQWPRKVWFPVMVAVYHDDQFSLTTTPAAFEQAHHAFMATYNTTAHQGLLNDRFDPPIPLEVLGEATGRRYSAEELNRHFAHDLFPRMTNPYGCVTLHHYHFYVEQGLPTAPVLLWLSGDQLRAVFDNVVVAEYHCHYDWRSRHVTNIRDGVFYRTRYASSQGALIPLIPQESRVLYRPQAKRRRRRQALPIRQLLLFEWIPTA